MKTRFSILGFILLFSMLSPRDAFSSLPWPLEALLGRAEYVFIVRVASRTSTNTTFEVTEVLRGDALKSLTLNHELGMRALTRHTSDILLFSQGDPYWGKPKPVVCIGQSIVGQASYCGWILWPIAINNSLKLERVKELLNKSPYKPDKYGRIPNKPQDSTARAPSVKRSEPQTVTINGVTYTAPLKPMP
ncbi:MAG: hypothetical protein WCV00_04495 [Verrucomicrobiia bacterium]|jgi:hypothetical protein